MANYDNIIVCMLLHLLLTLGACARALQYSVCLSVCYHSTACVRYLSIKLNVPANFAPNSKGFQLRDFVKKLSLTSYSLFFVLAHQSQPFFSSQCRKLELSRLRILLV